MNLEDILLNAEQECSAWRRLLEYLFQESSFLKTRLAEKTNQLTSGSTIEKAEQLHQTLMRNDEMLYFLKNDIGTLQKLLNIGIHISEQHPKLDIENRQKILRREMNAISNNFNDLQLQINSFFEESP